MKATHVLQFCWASAVVAGLGAGVSLGAEKTFGPDAKRLDESRRHAVEFLKTSQSDDGNWTTANSAGITSLCVTALLESGLSADDPAVARALGALERFVQKDGGIYHPSTGHKNYETCVALMAFEKANGGKKYDALIAKADKFLRGMQWDEGEGLETTDLKFGGAGYGRSQRPDLSNTQFLVDALKAAGAKDNDPAIQKALIFVSRSQNLESQHNSTPFAAKVNDGGFFYTPAAGGNSPAGTTENGGLRSYGSMTYAGLKSMIYAGLTRDDPRVKAADEWIRKHYSVSENPGMGRNGLFYYYNTFAKTFDVMKVDEFVDAQGERHDWRKELADQIISMQQKNGGWVNPAERWLEGDPNLTTAYALLALHYCTPKAGESLR